MIARLSRLLMLLALTGCPPGPAATPGAGTLLVSASPADAMLFIDDRYVGTVAGLRGRSVSLTEGIHRVELRKAGHFAHFSEVKIHRGGRHKVQISLRKELF